MAVGCEIEAPRRGPQVGEAMVEHPVFAVIGMRMLLSWQEAMDRAFSPRLVCLFWGCAPGWYAARRWR